MPENHFLPETFITKLSVFYSNNDTLTCSDVPPDTLPPDYNNTVVFIKCIDNILETKLKEKLSNVYEIIELQPLFVDKRKMLCTETYFKTTTSFSCNLPIKSNSFASRRKLIWKLVLVGKMGNFSSSHGSFVEPRSSRIFNETEMMLVVGQDVQDGSNERLAPKEDKIKEGWR